MPLNLDLPNVDPPEGMRLMHVVLFWFDADNLNWKTEMQAVTTDPVDAATQADSLRGLADTIQMEAEFIEVVKDTCAECGHSRDQHGSYGCYAAGGGADGFCTCVVPNGSV